MSNRPVYKVSRDGARIFLHMGTQIPGHEVEYNYTLEINYTQARGIATALDTAAYKAFLAEQEKDNENKS